MEKIYGYKEKDIIGLAQFILSKKGGTLTDAFSEYAGLSGKAQGTVRNLYYALAKKSRSDAEFCQKYLGGTPLTVGKIVEFDKAEEEKLIKAILKEKLNGKSVRSIIYSLANGDEKTALRYQNKFRNYIKNFPEQTETFTRELMPENSCFYEENAKKQLYSTQIKRLKGEINSLVDKISLNLRKENEKLKGKVTFLERENAKLKQELGLTAQTDGALRYFVKNNASVYN